MKNQPAVDSSPYSLTLSSHNNEYWSSDDTEDECLTHSTFNNSPNDLSSNTPKMYSPEDLLKNKEIDDIVQTIKAIKLRMDHLLDDITVNWTNLNKKDSLKHLTTLSDSEKIFLKLQNFANKYSTEFKNISEHMLQQKINVYEKYNLTNRKNILDNYKVKSIENTEDNIPSSSQIRNYLQPNGYCSTLLQMPSLDSDELKSFKIDTSKCNKEMLSLKSSDNVDHEDSTMDSMDVTDSQLAETYSHLEISKIIEINSKSAILQENADSEVSKNLNLIDTDNITLQIKKEMIDNVEFYNENIQNEQNINQSNDNSDCESITIKEEVLLKYEESLDDVSQVSSINSFLESFQKEDQNIDNCSEKNYKEVTNNNECTRRMKDVTNKLTDRLNKENLNSKDNDINIPINNSLGEKNCENQKEIKHNIIIQNENRNKESCGLNNSLVESTEKNKNKSKDSDQRILNSNSTVATATSTSNSFTSTNSSMKQKIKENTKKVSKSNSDFSDVNKKIGMSNNNNENVSSIKKKNYKDKSKDIEHQKSNTSVQKELQIKKDEKLTIVLKNKETGKISYNVQTSKRCNDDKNDRNKISNTKDKKILLETKQKNYSNNHKKIKTEKSRNNDKLPINQPTISDNIQKNTNSKPTINRRLSIEEYRKRCLQTDSTQTKNSSEHNAIDITSVVNNSHVELSNSKQCVSKDDYKSFVNHSKSVDNQEDKNKNIINDKSSIGRLSKEDCVNHMGNKIKEKTPNETFKTTEENNSSDNKDNKIRNVEKDKLNNEKSKFLKKSHSEDHKNDSSRNENDRKSFEKHRNEQKIKDSHPDKQIKETSKELNTNKDIKRFKKVQSRNISDNLQDTQNYSNKLNSVQDKNNQKIQLNENINSIKTEQENSPHKKNGDQNINIINDNIENIDPKSNKQVDVQESEVISIIDDKKQKVNYEYINGVPKTLKMFYDNWAKFDEEKDSKLLPPSKSSTEDNFQITELILQNQPKIQSNSVTDTQNIPLEINKQVNSVKKSHKTMHPDKNIKNNGSTTSKETSIPIPNISIKQEPCTDTYDENNSCLLNEIMKIKTEPIDSMLNKENIEKPENTSKVTLDVPTSTSKLHSTIKTERSDDLDNLSLMSDETQILERQLVPSIVNEESNQASSTTTITYIFKKEAQDVSNDNLIGKLYERQRILEDFEEDVDATNNSILSLGDCTLSIKQEEIDKFEKETQLLNEEINTNPQQNSADLIILSDSEPNSECEDAYISLLCDSSNSISDSDLSESSDTQTFENVGQINNFMFTKIPLSSEDIDEYYKRLYNIQNSFVYMGERIVYDEWKRDYEKFLRETTEEEGGEEKDDEQRIDKRKDDVEKINDKEKDEENEINRLTNLKNLDNFSKSKNYNAEGEYIYKKKSSKQTKKSSDNNDNCPSDMEDTTDNEFSFLAAFSQINPEYSIEKIPEPSVPIFVDDHSDVDINNDDNDNDVTNDKIDDKKRLKRLKLNEKDQMSNETLSSDEPKKKRSKWRNDRLLNQKLGSSDSDVTFFSSEEENDEQNKNKIKKRRISNADSTKTSKTTSSYSIFSTDSESDSDVEFISETENKDLKRKYKRRNIRKVESDEFLQESTKQAIQEEENRKKRISMKQLTLNLICSQPETQEEGEIVLDVDENSKPIIKINKILAENLKPHQLEGIKFMWSICFENVKSTQEEPGVGCILAHCMGLGKTRQIVVLSHTVISHKILNIKKVLIVCPLSTVSNWKNEFKNTLKNLNNITVITFEIRANYSCHKKFQTVKMWHEMGGVLIIGYDTFQAFIRNKKNKTQEQLKFLKESLINPGPQLLVCDEGHMLKNGKTLRFKLLSNIATKRRIILTGTPLQNNLKEYYHMVNFVKPNLLGTETEYNNRFVNPILNGQYEDSSPEDIHLMRKRAHVLHKKLETTIQRFESSELEKYMPPKEDFVIYLQMSSLQKELYKRYLEYIENEELINNKKKSLFYNYHTLQYIWTHPAMFKMKLEKKNDKKLKLRTYDEDYIVDLDPDNIDPKENLSNLTWYNDICPDDIKNNISYGPKMEVLFDIIKQCVKLGDKLLVFASSLIELDLIEHFLNVQNTGITWLKNVDYFRMDGTVEPETRSRYCDSFNNERNTMAKLFLISHKVGGLGLNLFAANRVVLMDVNWNPTYDDQSVFRIFRFGQNKKCTIYRLISMGTMEEVVHSRAITKLAISARVVDEQQIIRHFKSDDLQKMYELNCDYGPRIITEKPQDSILCNLILKHPTLNKYCKHKTLLQNLPHEELNEEEQNEAWKEFNREIEIQEEKLKNKYNPTLPKTTFIPNLSTLQPKTSVNYMTIQENEQNTVIYSSNRSCPYSTFNRTCDKQYNPYNGLHYNQYTNIHNFQTNNIPINMGQVSLNSNYGNMHSGYQQPSDQSPYLQTAYQACLSDFITNERNLYSNNPYMNTFYDQALQTPYTSNNNQTLNQSYQNSLNHNFNMNASTSNQQYVDVSHQSTLNNIGTVNQNITNSNSANSSSISTVNNSISRLPKPLNKSDNRNIIHINTTASFLNMPKSNAESITNNRNVIAISTENNLGDKEKENNTINANPVNNNFTEKQVSLNSVDLNVNKNPVNIQLQKLTENKPNKTSSTSQVQDLLLLQNTLKHVDKPKNTNPATKDVLIQHAEKLQTLKSLTLLQVDNSTKSETFNKNLNYSKQITGTINSMEKDNKHDHKGLTSLLKKTEPNKTIVSTTKKNEICTKNKVTENNIKKSASKTQENDIKLNDTTSIRVKKSSMISEHKIDTTSSGTPSNSDERKVQGVSETNKSNMYNSDDCVNISSSEEANKNSLRSVKHFVKHNSKHKYWLNNRNYYNPYKYNMSNRSRPYEQMHSNSLHYNREFDRRDSFNSQYKYTSVYKNDYPNKTFNYYGRRQY